MEQPIFKLTLIIEGAPEKVSQFKLPLKSIYSKKICFNQLKCIFWTPQKDKNNKQSL
jgi:hypothetical protein